MSLASQGSSRSSKTRSVYLETPCSLRDLSPAHGQLAVGCKAGNPRGDLGDVLTLGVGDTRPEQAQAGRCGRTALVAGQGMATGKLIADLGFKGVFSYLHLCQGCFTEFLRAAWGQTAALAGDGLLTACLVPPLLYSSSSSALPHADELPAGSCTVDAGQPLSSCHTRPCSARVDEESQQSSTSLASLSGKIISSFTQQVLMGKATTPM